MMIKSASIPLVLVGVVCGAAALTSPPRVASTTSASPPRSAVSERSPGGRFPAPPSADKAREAHQLLTAEPHVAGSPRDRVLAEWVRDRWREYGLEQVEIVEHEVLLPYATDVTGEIPSPHRHASLRKAPVPLHPPSPLH